MYTHSHTYLRKGGARRRFMRSFVRPAAVIGVRWVAAWAPGTSQYVSSFAGTDSSDEASGYIRSTSAGGSEIRYDLVRVSAVPAPTSLALAFCGLALAAVAGRRRK